MGDYILNLEQELQQLNQIENPTESELERIQELEWFVEGYWESALEALETVIYQ